MNDGMQPWNSAVRCSAGAGAVQGRCRPLPAVTGPLIGAVGYVDGNLEKALSDVSEFRGAHMANQQSHRDRS